MLFCYSAGIHGQDGHIFLLFHDSYPRPNWQIFLLHVKNKAKSAIYPLYLDKYETYAVYNRTVRQST